MKAKPIMHLADLFREIFHYDEETGDLIWKDRKQNGFGLGGKVAGYKMMQHGAVHHKIRIDVLLRVDGKKTHFGAHNIIFAMKGIEIPEGMVIDHINGDAHCNAWSNLRLCTQSQNIQNSKKRNYRHVFGPLLPKGVRFVRKSRRFDAQICVNGNKKSLGTYDTPEEAYQAYCRAGAELHGEFFRDR